MVLLSIEDMVEETNCRFLTFIKAIKIKKNKAIRNKETKSHQKKYQLKMGMDKLPLSIVSVDNPLHLRVCLALLRVSSATLFVTLFVVIKK